MAVIKTPASSANIGPGFDTLGIALAVFNTFDVRPSGKNILHGTEKRYDNEDNLFLQAYRFGCEAIGVHDCAEVSFDCGIPTSRGMGSSASFIAAGITAASVLHDYALSKDEIFQLACQMEGHPDNIAPCIYGSLSMSMKLHDGSYATRKIPVHDSWRFTMLVPDFEVSTKKAREALPDAYSRRVLTDSCSRALLLTEALRSGDQDLLKEASFDEIHEPYRKPLIRDYETVRDIALADADGAFVISGSGPACMLISKKVLSEEAESRIRSASSAGWRVIRTVCPESGTIIESE